MDRFEKIIIGMFLITVIVGLVYGFIYRGNIEEILSEGCEEKELTDWTRYTMGYGIECNGVVQNKTCYINSPPYCAKNDKWGNCANWERKIKELDCREINDAKRGVSE